MNINNSSINKLDIIRIVLSATLVFVSLASSSYFMDAYTKTKWVALSTGVLVLTTVLLSIEFKISKRWYLPIGLVAIYLTRIGFGISSFPLEQLMIVLAMIIVAYSTWVVLGQHSEPPKELIIANLIALVSVTVLGYLQKSGFATFFENLGSNEFPASTFGFQNMTAEFVGFSILFALIYSDGSTSSLKWVSRTCILLSLPYLYLLKSRTAFLGFSVSIALVLPFLLKSSKKLWLTLGTACGVACILAGIIFKIQSDPQISQIKKANTEIRFTRWKNTVEMIRSHPFGVGIGNFPFSYLDFHSKTGIDSESTEEQLVRSPHNAFLGIAAEAGVGILVITLAFISITVFYCFKLLLSPETKKEKQRRTLLYLAGTAYYLVDGLFNFPLELAYTCYTIALIAGFGWSVFDPKRLNFNGKGILGVALLLFAYLAGGYTYSEYVIANKIDDVESMSRACTLFPGNYFTCARKAEIEAYSGEYEKAIQTSTELLKIQPNFFPALRVRGDAYLSLNRRDLACLDYRAYNSLFAETAAPDPVVATACADQ